MRDGKAWNAIIFNFMCCSPQYSFMVAVHCCVCYVYIWCFSGFMHVTHHSSCWFWHHGVWGQESGLGVDPFGATGPQSLAWAHRETKCIMLELEMLWALLLIRWCHSRALCSKVLLSISISWNSLQTNMALVSDTVTCGKHHAISPSIVTCGQLAKLWWVHH